MLGSRFVLQKSCWEREREKELVACCFLGVVSLLPFFGSFSAVCNCGITWSYPLLGFVFVPSVVMQNLVPVF